ncbi:asparaginase-domain-containing protein [Hypoxylon sp. FL0543]|nr:asparaginase-domain-containing protein [Hypoxylon sp. FL0543]
MAYSSRFGLTSYILWVSASAIARSDAGNSPGLPMVINTWGGPFTAATDAAYLSLLKPETSALDAVELGCATCEAEQCDGSVGFGGSPDENCETTLDAMIMDGTTMKAGAVAALRRIGDAVSVARAVLEHTTHTLLAGDQATDFAVSNGFVARNLTTGASAASCAQWRAARCQPNYRINVSPDPATSCGPYEPVAVDSGLLGRGRMEGHDTISLIALHASGAMAAGTSTNGASRKVPGRVGDGPITGSGSYVDGDVGGCGATGDGDVMMRFLPCYQAVENLRLGMSPTQAAEDAVRRMLRKYPDIQSGIVVVSNTGDHGGAGSGWTFTYAYRGGAMDESVVVSVPPLTGADVAADLRR